ncbi:hypothetical protein GCM10023080_034770 [Streptomyces pseudoechinosporeus]
MLPLSYALRDPLGTRPGSEIPGLEDPSDPFPKVAQSQSRRLKITYRLAQTTAIRTIANGWYSTANSPFGTDVGASPDGGFVVNVFLHDTVAAASHELGYLS